MLLWHSPALSSGDHTVYARTLTNALLRVRGLRVWPFIHIYVFCFDFIAIPPREPQAVGFGGFISISGMRMRL